MDAKNRRVDRAAVGAIAEAVMNGSGNGQTDRAHRTVAEGHIKRSDVGAAPWDIRPVARGVAAGQTVEGISRRFGRATGIAVETVAVRLAVEIVVGV